MVWSNEFPALSSYYRCGIFWFSSGHQIEIEIDKIDIHYSPDWLVYGMYDVSKATVMCYSLTYLLSSVDWVTVYTNKTRREFKAYIHEQLEALAHGYAELGMDSSWIILLGSLYSTLFIAVSVPTLDDTKISRGIPVLTYWTVSTSYKTKHVLFAVVLCALVSQSLLTESRECTRACVWTNCRTRTYIRACAHMHFGHETMKIDPSLFKRKAKLSALEQVRVVFGNTFGIISSIQGGWHLVLHDHNDDDG